MMITLLLIFFVLGLIIGSFLNVIICRFNTQRSLGGRSACMSCQNKLSWYELLPLVSFLALRGRCRTCQTRVSFVYPLVEFTTGLVFCLLFLKFSAQGGSASGGQNYFFLAPVVFTVTYLYYAVAFSLLVIIAAYDLKHKIIPDPFVFIFGTLSFLGLFFFNGSVFSGFYPHWPSGLEFLSGPLIALPLALFWLVSNGTWMGLGDAKLALGLGWLLGLSPALSGVVIAFWSGAIIGLCLIVLSRNHGMKSQIPFAPYLIFGALTAFLFQLNLFGI